MKTFRERAIELANDCKRVKNNNVYETLAKEFNISKRNASDRFKSLFASNIRDYISNNILPNKEKLIDCIIKSNNWNEFYKLSGMNDSNKLSKLLHNNFGNSNYFKVKLKLISKIPNEKYNVNREDNESILISQYIGDGHIERKSSIKIEHGWKQYDYLKFKIGLLNKAYPMTNGLENITRRTHDNGYISYTYRTGQVLQKQFEKILGNSLNVNINNLTPFGICIYYLDDGYLTYSDKYDTVELGFSSINNELKFSLHKYFMGYGYTFNIQPKSLVLQSKLEIVKFIKDFIEPYEYLLPKCIHYKFNYKDIVG